MLALTALINVANGAKRVRFASPVVQGVAEIPAEDEETRGPASPQRGFSPAIQTLYPWGIPVEDAAVNATATRPPDDQAAHPPVQSIAFTWTSNPTAQPPSTGAPTVPPVSSLRGTPLLSMTGPGPAGVPVLPYALHPAFQEQQGAYVANAFPLYAASGVVPQSVPGQTTTALGPQAFFTPPTDMLQSVSTTAPLLTLAPLALPNQAALGGATAPNERRQPTLPVFTPVLPVPRGPTYVKPRSAEAGNEDLMEELRRDEALRRGKPLPQHKPFEIPSSVTKGLAVVGAFVAAKKGAHGLAQLYRMARGIGGQ